MGQTDGPIDWPTDGPTDEPTQWLIVACTWLKTTVVFKFRLKQVRSGNKMRLAADQKLKSTFWVFFPQYSKTDIGRDGVTGGQTLLYRCEDASKKRKKTSKKRKKQRKEKKETKLTSFYYHDNPAYLPPQIVGIQRVWCRSGSLINPPRRTKRINKISICKEKYIISTGPEPGLWRWKKLGNCVNDSDYSCNNEKCHSSLMQFPC